MSDLINVTAAVVAFVMLPGALVLLAAIVLGALLLAVELRGAR